jgi:mannose-6-phosphate isomerase
MFRDVRSAATFMEAWMREQALPLWATSGFDAEVGRFEEGLTFGSEPRRQVPIRLLVQARQIFVYALAERRRWHPGSDELVEQAFAAMKRDYFRPDGRDGWAFSIARDGSVVDATRDLYAHAFVLLAVASYVQATGKQEGLAAAHETLATCICSRPCSHCGSAQETATSWREAGSCSICFSRGSFWIGRECFSSTSTPR